MGRATRFMTLLTAHRSTFFTAVFPLSPSLPCVSTPFLLLPWPEWTNFLKFLSNGQGYPATEGDRIPPEDAFVVYEELTGDFVSAAAACIAFARARPDLIGLIAFKDGYRSSCIEWYSIFCSEVHLTWQEGCTFMNFARNIKCLECEEPKPKKQLTGGEWECPQCNFSNYGRNVVCLRCDCRRPGAPLFNNNSSQNIGTKLSPVSQSGSSGSSNSNHVPFVPLPADAFSRTGQTSEMHNGNKVPLEVNNTSSSDVRNRNNYKQQISGFSWEFSVC